MVFQNKLNVGQYLFICFAFILPFLFCSNASAIRQNVYGIRIYNLSYITQHPNGTITDLALLSGTYHPLTNATIAANDVFNIARLKGKFAATYNVKKNKKWTYEISIIVGYKNLAGQGYEGSPIPQAQCPIGDSQWVIDNCKITIENFDGNPYNIYSAGQNVPISDAGELLLSSYEYNRWVIKLDGHWKGNDQNIDYFETGGVILSIYNPSVLSQQIQYSFAMPTFYFFDEEESAEEEVAEKELESTTNIENQTPQSSSGGSSENQQTTNLIGVFSGFLGQLQSFSATNCNLDLPFPAFIGGTQTVNICQGKDVLGNFITIVGTLAMLTFYIPLAFVLLKMIYNEIRSFTNG